MGQESSRDKKLATEFAKYKADAKRTGKKNFVSLAEGALRSAPRVEQSTQDVLRTPFQRTDCDGTSEHSSAVVSVKSAGSAASNYLRPSNQLRTGTGNNSDKSSCKESPSQRKKLSIIDEPPKSGESDYSSSVTGSSVSSGSRRLRLRRRSTASTDEAKSSSPNGHAVKLPPIQ